MAQNQESNDRASRSNQERGVSRYRPRSHTGFHMFLQVPSTSQYNPLQGGNGFDPHTFGYCNGVPAGGDLFERICTAGRFSEDEARYFIQQLMSGVNFFHAMQICHKDLKQENTLLDGSPTPRLKICDFDYSKDFAIIIITFYCHPCCIHVPNQTIGTPAYIALEVLSRREYDGKVHKQEGCNIRRSNNNEIYTKGHKDVDWNLILYDQE
ncbi:hypothetical protein K1719_018576 [Acacia pycnantha]|nr:hypothetical protein K1719_018576 [Acacia pycnantha]